MHVQVRTEREAGVIWMETGVARRVWSQSASSGHCGSDDMNPGSPSSHRCSPLVFSAQPSRTSG